MSERDFQAEVLNALGELKAEQAGTRAEVAAVKDHLARLNGRVVEQEKRTGEIQIELAERRNKCPIADALEDRIRPVEDFIVAERAAEKTSATWLKWLWPIIWAAIGAFALLVLLHANNFLKIRGA